MRRAFPGYILFRGRILLEGFFLSAGRAPAEAAIFRTAPQTSSIWAFVNARPEGR